MHKKKDDASSTEDASSIQRVLWKQILKYVKHTFHIKWEKMWKSANLISFRENSEVQDIRFTIFRK